MTKTNAANGRPARKHKASLTLLGGKYVKLKTVSEMTYFWDPAWGRGTPFPVFFSFVSIHILTFCFVYFFPFSHLLYLFSIFVHPFPFYQKSHHCVSRTEIVGGD